METHDAGAGHKTNEELNKAVQEARHGKWDEARCGVCGWPLDVSGNVSSPRCLPDNCSMRPTPERRADTPADICGDPAAWGGLFIWLKEQGLQPVLEGYDNFGYTAEVGPDPRTPMNDTLPGRALARAFLKARGLWTQAEN